jgi:hypothetical protein
MFKLRATRTVLTGLLVFGRLVGLAPKVAFVLYLALAGLLVLIVGLVLIGAPRMLWVRAIQAGLPASVAGGVALLLLLLLLDHRAPFVEVGTESSPLWIAETKRPRR